MWSFDIFTVHFNDYIIKYIESHRNIDYNQIVDNQISFQDHCVFIILAQLFLICTMHGDQNKLSRAIDW